jgi:maltooligosyltrehalose trehalohydrolase
MLFMGEEWGASTPWQFFTSHPEPELGKATAEGRIAEFAKMGWDPAVVPDPQDPETFWRSKLDWSEPQTGAHAALLDLHRRLIDLRHRLPELTDPRFPTIDAVADDAAGTIVLRRGGVTVAANLGIAESRVPAAGSLVLTTAPGVAVDGGRLVLPAESAAITVAL